MMGKWLWASEGVSFGGALTGGASRPVHIPALTARSI